MVSNPMEIRFKTAPHGRQLEFMDADEREQLFGGAKRGGKSHGGAQKITMLSMAFPGNRGLLYRQNLTDLKDSTLVTFFQTCPPELIKAHHKGDRMVTFINGSHFIYRGVGDERELEKVKGIDLGWMYGDEPTEVEESTYLMLLAQLNWKLPNGTRPSYQSLLTSNPEPGWVERRFIKPLAKDPKTHALLEYKAGPDKIFIPSLPSDNPYLPFGYIDYLLANFPPEWVEKYVRGSWEVSEGMVYKEFDKQTHLVDYHPPLAELKLYASLDHATTGVTCFLVVGVDANSNFWVIRCYYRKDRLVQDHADSILAIITDLERAGGTLEYCLCDPAMSQRSTQGNYQLQNVRELYAEKGIHTIPAWNTIVAGVERLQTLLHVSPSHVHPLTDKLGSPRLFIYNCPELVEEFLGWKKTVDQYGYITYKGADHALDNLRYIAISRPAPIVITTLDEAHLGSMSAFASRSHANWVKKFDQQIRRQNGYGGNSYY